MSALKLKAFTVLEDFENTGGIVFAEHAVTARRLGADAWGDGDFSLVSCRRAPWADRFAETGVVPASELIWNGWRFECAYCGRRIEADIRPYRSWTPDMAMGSQNSAVYCDRSCRAAQLNARAFGARLAERVLRRYSERLTRRMPGISVRGLGHAYSGSYVYVSCGRVAHVVINFDWPGQKHGPASFRWEAKSRRLSHVVNGITCCAGDMPEFEAFAAQCRQNPPETHQEQENRLENAKNGRADSTR